MTTTTSTPTPQIDDLLTSREVADRLGVNRRTVTRWAESGRLRIAERIDKLRGAYLFRPEDVEQARHG